MNLSQRTEQKGRKRRKKKRRAKEALRTKEIRAPSRCASAPPKGLFWGSRDTESKEAEKVKQHVRKSRSQSSSCALLKVLAYVTRSYLSM